MQVTKGTWRMREQCVPGSLSSSHAREPGNEASDDAMQELERWMTFKTYILCILEYTSLLCCYNQIQKFVIEQIDIVAICTLQQQNVF